jgi:hypothetical protein
MTCYEGLFFIKAGGGKRPDLAGIQTGCIYIRQLICSRATVIR